MSSKVADCRLNICEVMELGRTSIQKVNAIKKAKKIIIKNPSVFVCSLRRNDSVFSFFSLFSSTISVLWTR